MTATTPAAITFARLGPDAEAIRNLHGATDCRDRRQRFLGASDGPVPAQGTVGAYAGGRLIGVATYTASAGVDAAEVVVLVAADHERGGVGVGLLRQLARLARARGIRRFVADITPGDSRMMRLLIDADFAIGAYRHNGRARVSAEF
ncbi:GNAT family N-acetyltransferase [Nocardia arizonensis]|uniref:GNAT family N-acetyltransferase n=1 Tax=Nocardia arizonensis TaxID=1141647 RepID=UPI0006D1A198|nr:GNAT family N-acetyltransferase [Nocardia arizonensis]